MIDFDELIINHLSKEAYPKKPGVYYPSSIGSCIRKYWYSYKHPADVKPELHKIFHMGNVLHDFVVDVLKSEKNPHIELVKSELPVKMEHKSFMISGRIDDVVIVKSNGRTILIEVKSVKDIRYMKKPSLHHIMQIQFYMYASGIHNGIILYIDREGLNTKPFEVEYSREFSEKILRRFEDFHGFLTQDILPEAEAKKDPETRWMCKNCEHAERCGKNEV